MDNNIILTKEQLKEVVDRKVADQLRTMPPVAQNVTPTGYVKVKADHDSRYEKARIVGEYCHALFTGRTGDAYQIARNANEKYITRANFNTGTSAQGGAAVPQFWVEEIMSFADTFGYARALAKIYPMRGKTENLVSSGAFTGGVVAEGSSLTLTDSANFFTPTQLIAKKIIAGAIISEEQLQDATPAFLDYVVNGLGRALAETEDKQFFNGDGTGANFTGILGTASTTVTYQGGTSTSGKDTFGEISWKDLINLRLSINSSVGANGVFVVPQSVFGFLMKETDSVNGRPIFDMVKPMDVPAIGMTALEGNTYVSITGRPLHVVPDALFPTSAANKASAIYADFSQFTVMGIREDVSVNEYKEYFGATGLGGTHQKGIEVVERVGFAFPAPSAIGILKTSVS
jgi:HK97 family phage major capsid protein